MDKKAEIRRLAGSVMRFSHKMQSKLERKVHEGYTGWDDMASLTFIMERLKERVDRLMVGDYRQCVDIANFAMMIDGLYESGSPDAGEGGQ